MLSRHQPTLSLMFCNVRPTAWQHECTKSLVIRKALIKSVLPCSPWTGFQIKHASAWFISKYKITFLHLRTDYRQDAFNQRLLSDWVYPAKSSEAHLDTFSLHTFYSELLIWVAALFPGVKLRNAVKWINTQSYTDSGLGRLAFQTRQSYCLISSTGKTCWHIVPLHWQISQCMPNWCAWTLYPVGGLTISRPMQFGKLPSQDC